MDQQTPSPDELTHQTREFDAGLKEKTGQHLTPMPEPEEEEQDDPYVYTVSTEEFVEAAESASQGE